jgi:methylmalonyl-CoA epimerase
MSMAPNQELEALRSQLDALDAELLQGLARRFRVIDEIANLKKRTQVAVVQPERVNAIFEGRMQLAEELGVNPQLVRRLWSLIIAEACRVENAVVGNDNRSLKNQAARIDHVAIAVRNLEEAVNFYETRLGLETVERWSIEGAYSGMNAAVLEAGAVTLVLVEGTNPESNVSLYVAAYGPGVQHIAFEVDDIDGAYDELTERGFTLIGGIYNLGGLSQVFSRRDRNSGMQIEIVSRRSSARFESENVRKLFAIMEKEGVY